VISGEIKSVEKAIERAKALGGKIIKLNVSGAFHSPLMAPVQKALKEYLDSMNFAPLKFDFVSNVTGKKVANEVRAKELLPEQLVKMVLWWFDCMKTITDTVDFGFELGGGVLTGLVKYDFPLFCYLAIDEFQKLEKISFS